jgi:hypothetical protein
MEDVEWHIEERSESDDGGAEDAAAGEGRALRGLRVVLLATSMAALFGWDRANQYVDVHLSRSFVTPWGGWLWLVGMLIVSGAAFGLAAMLPRRRSYRPGRAFVLGLVPLLLVAHVTLALGPGRDYTIEHLPFLDHFLFGFEVEGGRLIAPVLLGLALVAGFEPGD